jgi:hypothetical protein
LSGELEGLASESCWLFFCLFFMVLIPTLLI